jgi:hypothetical protein
MDPNRLALEQDEFNAHVLRGVMGATGQPGETAEDLQTRCAGIVEIFRTFEAANPMEAMLACHCISLRFMLEAAMRDANATDLQPAMLIRLRASVMAIGKSLHLWMSDFASLHARNEARAAESTRRTGQPDSVALSAKPRPAAVQPPTARSEQPRPVAATPVNLVPPFVAATASGAQKTWRVADLPAQSTKQALLSSAAASCAVAANGRLTAMTPSPGR